MLDYHLLVFVTVAEKKNFSRAGEELNLTQPAISQHIRSLEEHYGTRLLERSNRRVELTRAGEVLYAYAKEILALHQRVERAVSDLVGTVAGKMVVGASLTIGEYVLPRLLGSFARKYPAVEVAMTVGNTAMIAERALDGGVDIGLVEGPVDHPNLVVDPFLGDEMVIIVPGDHPLAEKDLVETQDLAGQTFILREEGSGTRLAADKALGAMDLTPERVIQLGSTQAIKQAVEAGLGVSFMSCWAIRREVALRTLKPVRHMDALITRDFYLVRHRARFQSRAAEEFVRFITSEKVQTCLRALA